MKKSLKIKVVHGALAFYIFDLERTRIRFEAFRRQITRLRMLINWT